MRQLYEAIGARYGDRRRADPRLEARVHAALGTAKTVLNVGAGTGSYEPRDRAVIAVEPSVTMLQGRSPRGAPAVRAVAESLPFRDRSFDAALGVLTVHHWRDLGSGLAELRRVAHRQVIFMFEPAMAPQFWLIREYFPASLNLASEAGAPSVDGFTGAYWNRPESYLDPTVRAPMSTLAQLPADVVNAGVQRLRHDLESGAWDARHGHLKQLTEFDLGYRLVVAR